VKGSESETDENFSNFIRKLQYSCTQLYGDVLFIFDLSTVGYSGVGL